MAKDVTRTSKWHSFYEGPFEVVRKNTGGAYILKDAANSILPFRFPPSHLKLVPKSQPLMEKSYPIKKILAHAAIENDPYKYDYYVQFDIPDTTPVWISSEMFDSLIPIERYWKNISKQNLKATTNNTSTTRHENTEDTTQKPETVLSDNTQDDQEAAVSNDEKQTQDDRGAAVPADAKQTQDDQEAAVPVDENQTTIQDDNSVAPKNKKTSTKKKPTWTYEDIETPPPKDITAPPTNKRKRNKPINVFKGGSVEKSNILNNFTTRSQEIIQGKWAEYPILSLRDHGKYLTTDKGIQEVKRRDKKSGCDSDKSLRELTDPHPSINS
jgi:hypothetical protein